MRTTTTYSQRGETTKLGRELIGISVRYRSVFSQYEGAIPYKYKFQLEDHVCDNTLVNPKLCNMLFIYIKVS